MSAPARLGARNAGGGRRDPGPLGGGVRGCRRPVDLYPQRGDPADSILDVAEERNADLIIVGNRGRTGAKRFLLGSVPNRISHHAPCAVLIIRTP